MFLNDHELFQREGERREYISRQAKSRISLLFHGSCDVTENHVQSEYYNPLLLLYFYLLFSWTEIWEHGRAEGRDVTPTPCWASAHEGPPARSGF